MRRRFAAAPSPSQRPLTPNTFGRDKQPIAVGLGGFDVFSLLLGSRPHTLNPRVAPGAYFTNGGRACAPCVLTRFPISILEGEQTTRSRRNSAGGPGITRYPAHPNVALLARIERNGRGSTLTELHINLQPHLWNARIHAVNTQFPHQLCAIGIDSLRADAKLAGDLLCPQAFDQIIKTSRSRSLSDPRGS